MDTKGGLVLIHPEAVRAPVAIDKQTDFQLGWYNPSSDLVLIRPGGELVRGSRFGSRTNSDFLRITATEAVALHFICMWKETHQHLTLTIKESMKMYGIQRLPVVIPRINKRLPSGVWIECEMVRESRTLQYGKWKLHDPDNQFRFLVQGVR